jgi:hypothetical protein
MYSIQVYRYVKVTVQSLLENRGWGGGTGYLDEKPKTENLVQLPLHKKMTGLGERKTSFMEEME